MSKIDKTDPDYYRGCISGRHQYAEPTLQVSGFGCRTSVIKRCQICGRVVRIDRKMPRRYRRAIERLIGRD